MSGEIITVGQRLLEEQFRTAEDIETARVAMLGLLRNSQDPWEVSDLITAVKYETQVPGCWVQTAEDELVGEGVIGFSRGKRVLNQERADFLYPSEE